MQRNDKDAKKKAKAKVSKAKDVFSLGVPKVESFISDRDAARYRAQEKQREQQDRRRRALKRAGGEEQVAGVLSKIMSNNPHEKDDRFLTTAGKDLEHGLLTIPHGITNFGRSIEHFNDTPEQKAALNRTADPDLGPDEHKAEWDKAREVEKRRKQAEAALKQGQAGMEQLAADMEKKQQNTAILHNYLEGVRQQYNPQIRTALDVAAQNYATGQQAAHDIGGFYNQASDRMGAQGAAIAKDSSNIVKALKGAGNVQKGLGADYMTASAGSGATTAGTIGAAADAYMRKSAAHTADMGAVAAEDARNQAVLQRRNDLRRADELRGQKYHDVALAKNKANEDVAAADEKATKKQADDASTQYTIAKDVQSGVTDSAMGRQIAIAMGVGNESYLKALDATGAQVAAQKAAEAATLAKMMGTLGAKP